MTAFIQDLSLSDELKKTVKIAQAIAKEYMHPEFAPAHLLKALLHEEAGLLPVLESLDQDVFYLEEWAEVRIESLPKSVVYSELIPGNSSISELINEAESIRLKLSQEFLTPVHLLAAISTPGVAFSYVQLKSFPLLREDLINQIAANGEILSALAKPENTLAPDSSASKSPHALLKFCRDKTQLAREGKLDNIVGRENELRMMAEILCRRSKPNVLLIGEPGVGKSALADGFALAVVNQKVPMRLHNARVFELDSGSLVAGASYKGEVEERLKSILAEIKKFDKAILFIDEIHSLLDRQGPAAGSANLLKPELARGEITVIGATTLDEYRKYLEPDEAFSRRFELLLVEEPSAQTCYHMLKAVLPYYERHHGLSVPDETIHEAIKLAKRYLKDRRLPDAAIDLADRSMAALRLINDSGTKAIQEASNKFHQWCESGDQGHSLEEWKWFCHQLRQEVSPILWGAIQSEEDPDKMLQVGDVKNYLRHALEVLTLAASITHTTLGKPELAAIVSHKTGIPIGKVQTQERERLLNMETGLKQRVVGQDHAIRSIADAVLESRAGLSKPGQPLGSFFFLGPTGTGKTELAKSLAEFLFQDESFMIRFDMSEFKEEHAAALLYGAPPGYVGYEEGGLLVNKIRQKPYSVVLFDEIEKAHASVFDVFLQIMDEGKLHDKLGKEGDFSNALIIFTSNIGSSYVAEQFNKGQIPSSQKLLETMGQYFRPEFLGRLTEIVPFAPMNENMVKNILRIQLRNLYRTLEKQGVRLVITEKAFEQLALSGFTPAYGARPLAGIIRTEIRRPVSKKIIQGEVKAGDAITLSMDGEGGFQWEISDMLQEEKVE